MKAERIDVLAVARDIEASLGVNEYSNAELAVWWDKLSKESMFCKEMLESALKLMYEGEQKARYGGYHKPNLITFQKYCREAREREVMRRERKRKEGEPRHEIIGSQSLGPKGKKLKCLVNDFLMRGLFTRDEFDEQVTEIMEGE